MSVATEIQRLNTAKADIKAAIEAKGVTVPSNATIDTYDDYVSQISGGGGGGSSADTEALKGMIDRYITGVTIPSGVTYIGWYAFANCSGLETVNSNTIGEANIPSGIVMIGSYAFYYCSSLTSVTIPNSVTTIQSSAFRSCTSLESINLPSGLTSIKPYTFYGCTSLESINIPSGVTSIGQYAFSGCTNLPNVTIPNSVKSIGANAFAYCDRLTSIDIPSGVTSIGNQAFQYCTSLTSITVKATTPPTLGNANAFANTNDCPIYVPCESVETYKSASGWSSHASRITCTQPTFQGKLLATYSDSHTESAECDSTSAITNGEITLSNLVSGEIGDCVTSIGNGAFYMCHTLSSVTIPDSVTSIGMGAFNACTSLTSITIPDSVTSIDDYAFADCMELTSITVNATVPPRLGENAFNYTNDCPIYVPSGSVSAYQSAWSDYASRIQAIPNS